jgi:hypothetical protein
MSERRVVAHFSCGAASAVATKMAIAKYGKDRVVIFNAFIVEEDADNRRFLGDCETWFDHPVTVLRDTKYGASAREVWRRERYMNGPFGASCSTRLKREVIEAACMSDDLHVMGFTIDEKNPERVKRFLGVGGICPLVEANLRHADCRAMIERAGLILPRRYAQGYGNANCVGCCKGGEKYWRKTRIDSPNDFAEVVQIQKEIGPGAYFFRNRQTGERWPLDQLPIDGPIDNLEPPECSLFCAMAEDEL